MIRSTLFFFGFQKIPQKSPGRISCVEDVKAEIEDTFGISSIEQKLIYQGQTLDDERLLRSLVNDVDAMEVDVYLGPKKISGRFLHLPPPKLNIAPEK